MTKNCRLLKVDPLHRACAPHVMPARDDKAADAIVASYGASGKGPIEVDLACCRYCHQSVPAADLVSPCGCKGSVAFAHHACVQKWISTKKTRSSLSCEVCGEIWRGDFDIPPEQVPSADEENESAFSVLCAAYERVLQGRERPLDRHLLTSVGRHVHGPWLRRRGSWWRRFWDGDATYLFSFDFNVADN